MNKTYKVIWSKVKQCYIVVSEKAGSFTNGIGLHSIKAAAIAIVLAGSMGMCSVCAAWTIGSVNNTPLDFTKSFQIFVAHNGGDGANSVSVATYLYYTPTDVTVRTGYDSYATLKGGSLYFYYDTVDSSEGGRDTNEYILLGDAKSILGGTSQEELENMIDNAVKNVNGDQTVNGDSDIKGDQNVDGNQDVGGDSTIGGNQTVNEALTVKGDTILADNVVTGDLEVDGDTNLHDTTVDGKLDVTGDQTVGGNQDVTGDQTVDGNSSIGGNQDIAGDLTVDGSTNLKDTTVDGKLDVTGDQTVDGNSSIGGNQDIAGDLTVDGSTNLKDTTVDGKLDVIGDAEVTGNIYAHGNVVANNAGFNNLAVTNGATIGNQTDFVNMKDGNVVATGDITAMGNLGVAGNTVLNGDVQMNSNASVKGDLTVGGTMSAQDAILGGQSVLGKFSQIDQKINKTGAAAAAMAGLHPLDFDEDQKLNFAAATGSYHGSSAVALGMFYRPNEQVMFNLAGSSSGSEHMYTLGASFALDRPSGTHVSSRRALTEKVQQLSAVNEAVIKQSMELQAKNDELQAELDDLKKIVMEMKKSA